MENKTIVGFLEELQKKLKKECSIFLNYDTGKFKVGIKTERNDYPYWISFEGNTIIEAVNKLKEYLNGNINLDVGSDKREPKVWFKEVKNE